MRKRFAMLIVFVLLTMALTACSSETTIKSSNITEMPGRYHLFQTYSSDEYLNFLENFDEAKYDIVDITVGHGHYDFSYAITYKDKTETE